MAYSLFVSLLFFSPVVIFTYYSSDNNSIELTLFNLQDF
jgi:hypothetical protein